MQDVLEQDLYKNNQRQGQNDDHSMAYAGYAMGILGALASILGFIGVIVLYAVNRQKSLFTRRHLAQALNFQITLTIISTIIFLLTIGVLFKGIFGSINSNHFIGLESVIKNSLFFAIFYSLIKVIFNGIGLLMVSQKKEWKIPVAIQFVKD